MAEVVSLIGAVAALAVGLVNIAGELQDVIKIRHDVTTNDEDSLIINEWIKTLILQQPSGTSAAAQRIRKIEKVPQSLRLNESSKKEYDPMVVSFGPYNHGKPDFKLAEEFKLISLRIYTSYCKKTTDDLRAKVVEVVDVARSCYVEGSTDAYSREEFTEMMLLDGCLILSLIEWLSYPDTKVMLIYEHLGALGFSNLYRDMFLLENQIPYQVLQALLSMRLSKDDEIFDVWNKFFNVVLYGEWFQSKKLKATIGRYENHQPLHLLEIFRALFLSKAGIGNSFRKPESVDKIDLKKYVHSFRSVTEFKAKGISFRPCSSKSGSDISFKSYYLFGKLEIPPMVIDQDTKSNLLNLIAYEMCPNNPNDFRVTSYVRFMKSLIQDHEDVKELRTKKILLNSMGSDDEVASMFKDIIAPPINVLVFDTVEERIQKHYNSKARTWIAELIAMYFKSPWTAIAFLAAVSVIVLPAVQTYFTIHPPKK